MKISFFILWNIVISIFLLCVLPANASLIGVSGPTSMLGGTATIISAPNDVNDDAAYNIAMQGFDEAQGVILPLNLTVDGGGFLASGTMVDSHMIFLNTGPGNSNQANSHFNVEWTFDGLILGVMSNSNGNLEVASTPYLGATGTLYPTVPFNARGIDSNNGGGGPYPLDGYGVIGNTIRVGMSVTEPGDWLRVVTEANPVPEPGTILLLGTGIIGLVGYRKKFKIKTC